MMAKRLSDFLLALCALALTSPILFMAMLLILLQDGRFPLYFAVRVGRGGQDFRMIKLRTMAVGADTRGGNSTAASDQRVTRLGTWLRRWKLDELTQFWNVLLGQMSIVGPRPNVRCGGTDLYTGAERHLLTVRPGITDLSSIVFSDEGDILKGADDPDATYDAVIRPWKSRLGLLYVDRNSYLVDLQIMWLTLLALVARRAALRGVDSILSAWNASDQLRHICARAVPLPRGQPPGLVV